MTERLVLRAHRASDLAAVADMWGDTSVTQFIGFTRNRQDAWFTMARLRGFWDLLGYGYWIAERRGSGKFIGELGFADFMRDLTPNISGEPEAGWAFAASAWNQGYGREAVTAIHRWLDTDGPGGPSVSVIDPANTASMKIALGLGYVPFATTVMNGVAIELLRRPAGQ